jgi:hypothetical protein
VSRRSRVIVPLSSDMDDATFMKHWNLRHRAGDVPSMRIDIPYYDGLECGYMRSYHIHCHEIERDGGTVNGHRPEYDHDHQEES